MRAARLIAAKDLRLRIRDRSALIVGVVAPLGLAFIFNLILGDIVDGSFVPTLAVVSEDPGDVAEGSHNLCAARRCDVDCACSRRATYVYVAAVIA